MREGFLVLDDPSKTGDEELFTHVDWSRTLAYAIGLNGVYVNLEGRETGGVVPEADKRMVLERLAKRLAEFKDPDTVRRSSSGCIFRKRRSAAGT
jgi:predicted AlkP superfamily phosphohydrolase/phosphomutase